MNSSLIEVLLLSLCDNQLKTLKHLEMSKDFVVELCQFVVLDKNTCLQMVFFFDDEEEERKKRLVF